jgi:hypothetical protein
MALLGEDRDRCFVHSYDKHELLLEVRWTICKLSVAACLQA